MPHIKCHICTVSGVSNIRDLGGYETSGGGKTAAGKFIRSASLASLDKSGEAELLGMGVDCVIDLRSAAERESAPDAVEGHSRIHYEHIPMLDYIQSSLAQGDLSVLPRSMPEMYTGLLDRAGESFKEIFDLFADDRFGRYLFHCTAGKDRTGLTAMLLLKLAGVPDEIVTEDYALTEKLLKPAPPGTYPDWIPRYLFRAEPETMRSTLEYLRRNYGGAGGYLSHIGVGDVKQSSILAKLLL